MERRVTNILLYYMVMVMASILKFSFTITNILFVATSSIITLLIVLSLNQSYFLQSYTSTVHVVTQSHSLQVDPTNISHIVFGLVGTTKAWHYRKPYTESWWRPNITRGYLYLDTAPTNDLLPWSLKSPPYRISDDNTKLLKKTHHVAPIMVRMVHAVIEVFREESEGVRWYIMGDDDSVFFFDNMVDVLAQYDHTKYMYIGGHSECISSNQLYSYDMGFGGAGLIMSYPLAKMVQKNIEDCFARYPYLNSADKILMTCVNDFGVSLTSHQGLHQIDLHGDISGFLASHPKAPLLSLHHIDHVDPLFRSMDRSESTKHLMKAANVDQSRMVQQTICYERKSNRSFSVSWGYSVHIYESIIPRSILKIPLETFKPWISKSQPPFYIFNTRPILDDSCVAPHVFSFESIRRKKNEIITNYLRVASRGLPACRLAGSHSSDLVKKILVLSPVRKPNLNGKTECCDVINTNDARVAKLILRDCLDDELVA